VCVCICVHMVCVHVRMRSIAFHSPNPHITDSHSCPIVFLTDKEVLGLFVNCVPTMGEHNRAIEKPERRRAG